MPSSKAAVIGSRNNNNKGISSSSSRLIPVIDIISIGLFAITSVWFLRWERRRRETEFLLPPPPSSFRRHQQQLHRRRLRLRSNDNNSSSRYDDYYGDHNNNDGSSTNGTTTTNNNGTVGSRGEAALSRPMPYLQSFQRCLQDPCHPATNPGGFIGLCVAENKLCLDLLAERLMQIGTSTAAFSDSTVYCYNSFLGLPIARDAVAYFLAKRFLLSAPAAVDDDDPPNNNTTSTTTIPLDNANHKQQQKKEQTRILISSPQQALSHIKPTNVALGAGCASLLNHLFFVLGEHGDACLIPAPYYAAFETDISVVAGCIPFGFHMANVAFGPTESDLNLAYVEARSKGLTPRFLLLTNPNCPLGVIYKPELIKNAIQWARKRGIQTIVDEIYALSTHKKYDHGYQSVIRVLDNQLGDDVHMLYALSKDFGASGLRVGILYSQNKTVMEALSHLQLFSCVSGPMQYVVSELLTDDVFVDHFLDESRNRIRWNYELCVQKLQEMVLPYVEADAGLFVYVDFSSLLPEKTWRYEAELSRLLFEYARVVFTPGETQCERTPGMFRICYAWVSPPILEIAMERVSKLVAKIRRMNWDDLNVRTLSTGII